MTTKTTNEPASAQQISYADWVVAQLCEIQGALTEEEVEFVNMLSRRDPFTLTDLEYVKLAGFACYRMD